MKVFKNNKERRDEALKIAVKDFKAMLETVDELGGLDYTMSCHGVDIKMSIDVRPLGSLSSR